MNKEENSKDKASKDPGLPDMIGRKANRRTKARRTRDRSVWFGIGMFGMVGWTVAITTVLGVFLGIRMDRAWPGPYSWTLTLFIIGLIAGLMNAWYWVRKESRLDDNNSE